MSIEWAEPMLTIRRNMATAEMHSLRDGVLGAFSAKCPGKTTPNEDSAACIPFEDFATVLALADGLGGRADGEQASRVAVEALAGEIRAAQGSQVMLRTAILNGIERANLEVMKLGSGAATTLAVAELNRNFLRTYHVGDSLAMVVNPIVGIKSRTIPHSPVGYALESGLLTSREAMRHEWLHLVSNVVGSREMRIEIGPLIEFAAEDTLLLASDGLFDNVMAEEIVAHLLEAELPQATEHLVQQAQSRMYRRPGEEHPSKPDDLTLLTYRCYPPRATP